VQTVWLIKGYFLSYDETRDGFATSGSFIAKVPARHRQTLDCSTRSTAPRYFRPAPILFMYKTDSLYDYFFPFIKNLPAKLCNDMFSLQTGSGVVGSCGGVYGLCRHFSWRNMDETYKRTLNMRKRNKFSLTVATLPSMLVMLCIFMSSYNMEVMRRLSNQMPDLCKRFTLRPFRHWAAFSLPVVAIY